MNTPVYGLRAFEGGQESHNVTFCMGCMGAAAHRPQTAWALISIQIWSNKSIVGPTNDRCELSSLWREMMTFADDAELFAAVRAKLFTAVVGDILDTMGLLHQFLPPHIKPLGHHMVTIGRATPVLEADFFGASVAGHSDIAAKPFGLVFHALDSLKPNEIYVCTGASPTYALWGELMSVRALHLKAAGAICDGYCRDSAGILKLNFPTFCYGSYAEDQGPRGKVVDFGSRSRLARSALARRHPVRRSRWRPCHSARGRA